MVGLFPKRNLSSGQRFCLLSGLRLASQNFRNFVRISEMAYFFLKFVWISRIFPRIATDSGGLRNAEKMTLKEILNNANNYGISNACNCLLKFCRV